MSAFELDQERRIHTQTVVELYALRRFQTEALAGIKALLHHSESTEDLNAALRENPVDLRQLVRRIEGRAD